MTSTQCASNYTLLPEWAEQEAVILAWPHELTDWNDWLEDTRATYVRLIQAINQAEASVVLLCRRQDIGLIKSLIPYQSSVLLVIADYNDTWVRDYAFLTCESAHGNAPVEFQFNGWGQKFDAGKDNQVNAKVLSELCKYRLQSSKLVLEGGALEIDQNQHLLSTASCLFNPLRNGDISEQEYRTQFTEMLGAENVTIFKYGHLEGDDTDGHIDTLVRFTPLRGLVVQGCFNRPDDPHFAGLKALKQECQRTFNGYDLFELPLPHIVTSKGERLPASYANFLICNKYVLVPIYEVAEDQVAVATLQKAFPNHTIEPVNCSTLIKQYGSLHCVTMQVPVDTLKPHVIKQALGGVSVFAPAGDH